MRGLCNSRLGKARGRASLGILKQGVAMKKFRIALGSLAALAAMAPAAGSDLDDWAKTVVDNGVLLKQAEASCGLSNKLTGRQSLTLTYGRAAVEQSVPLSQLVALEAAATASASEAARGDRFCVETKRRTPELVAAIKKAGQAIEKRRKARQ